MKSIVPAGTTRGNTVALRGHDESENALNPGNLRCLLKLMSKHSCAVKRRLQVCPNATWLSPAFQNDIIKVLADEVRVMIQQEISEAQYYTVLADETKDISKAEQLSIVTLLYNKIQGQVSNEDRTTNTRPTRQHSLPAHLQNSVLTADTTG